VKYLLIIVAGLLIAWRWRSSRSTKKLKEHQSSPQQNVVEMVRCAHCGLHLPATDAVITPQGSYCSKEHSNASSA